MGFLKHQFRQIKKFPTWFYFPPATLMRIYKLCLRTELIDPHNCWNEEKFPFVTLVWHNRLLFFPTVFPRCFRKQTVAVVSASRDGQYLADLLAYFEVGSIRGSSSRHGARVVTQALDAIEQAKNVVFTPDGPRGPRYKMSKGPIHLASRTGRPILPITINASSYWELRTWDRFQIPKPWAKLTIIMGEPIEIPPDLDDEQLEEYRQLAERKLLEITADFDKAAEPKKDCADPSSKGH